MSYIIHSAATFDEIRPTRTETVLSAQPRNTWLVALWTMGAALREGLVAYRRYEHLKSRRIPHDAALRHALGMQPVPKEQVINNEVSMKLACDV